MARILFSIGIVKTMEVINKTIWINGIKSIFQLNLLAENRGKRSSRGGGLIHRRIQSDVENFREKTARDRILFWKFMVGIKERNN